MNGECPTGDRLPRRYEVCELSRFRFSHLVSKWFSAIIFISQVTWLQLEPSELAAVAGLADTGDRTIRNFAQLDASLASTLHVLCRWISDVQRRLVCR